MVVTHTDKHLDVVYNKKNLALKQRWNLKMRGIRSTIAKFRFPNEVVWRLRIHKPQEATNV